MNRSAEKIMFKQMLALANSDEIKSFDDIEIFVKRYTAEYKRQKVKGIEEPDVSYLALKNTVSSEKRYSQK